MTSECTNESNLTSDFFFYLILQGPQFLFGDRMGKRKEQTPESIYLSGKYAGLTARGFLGADEGLSHDIHV